MRINKPELGFTIIELMVVIILLGLLSAVAMAKYVSLKSKANVSVLQGIKGEIVAMAYQVNAKARVDGVASQRNANIMVNGQRVRLRYGFPRSNQMFYTSPNQPGLITIDANNARVTTNIVRLENNNNCRIRYRQPTGLNQPPRIDTREQDC